MPSKHQAPSQWRNRIVGETDVDPATIAPSPYNWRTHPVLQKDAMAGVLRSLGWLQHLVVNQRTNRLIDGHLRLALALEHHEGTVPVLYVDLSEDEEKLALATFDPLTTMAEVNTDALARLLHEVESGDSAVQQLLAQLAEQEGIAPPNFQPASVTEQGRLDEKQRVVCPECGHAFVL